MHGQGGCAADVHWFRHEENCCIAWQVHHVQTQWSGGRVGACVVGWMRMGVNPRSCSARSQGLICTLQSISKHAFGGTSSAALAPELLTALLAMRPIDCVLSIVLDASCRCNIGSVPRLRGHDRRRACGDIWPVFFLEVVSCTSSHSAAANHDAAAAPLPHGLARLGFFLHVGISVKPVALTSCRKVCKAGRFAKQEALHTTVRLINSRAAV